MSVRAKQALVVAGEVEDRREVEFEELLGDGPSPLIIEPPPGAVGQDAPAQRARGQVVDPPQVAQHLGRGRGLLPPAVGPAVERAPPALGFDDRKPERIAPPFLDEAVGTVFRRGVLEQQAIGHILPTSRGEVLLA